MTDIPAKGNTKRKATAKLEEVLADFKRQETDLSRDVLFTVFITEWPENLKHSIEAATYEAYHINVHKRITPFFEPKKLKGHGDGTGA